MGQRIGYARVSSVGQNLDSQIDALKVAGCHRIFADKVSGSSLDRPEWQALMNYVRSGDTLVITELSRMSRSSLHLLKTVKELEDEKVEIVSLRENIDTTTPTGRFFFTMMGAISQMEREIKAERAHAGRLAAKARGKTGGRPRIDPKKLEQGKVLYENTKMTAREIGQQLGFSERTLYAYMQKEKEKEVADVGKTKP